MRILTWNIQWGRGIDGRVDLARIADYLRAQNVDVICLQEVSAYMSDLPGCDGDNQFEHLRELMTDYCAVEGAGLIQGRRRFGNLILTRLPVLQTFIHPLPWLADGARALPRCAVEAVLATMLGPLRVVTSHLEYFSGAARMAQIEAIAAIMRNAHARSQHQFEESAGPYATLPHTALSILTGDFNLRSDDVALAPLASLMWDAWSELHDAPHPPSFCIAEQIYGSPHCCDFIFVSEPLRSRLRSISYDVETRLSDHQPVLLELCEAEV